MRALTLLPLFAAIACKPDPEPGKPSLDPCSGDSGTLCTWLGVPGVAMLAPEGTHRLEANSYLPQDGVFDSLGRFVFIDFNNHRLRRVNEDDTVETVAGTGFLGDGVVVGGAPLPEGPALDFAFNHPTDLAFDPADDTHLLVAAWHNSRITLVEMHDDPIENMARFHCGTGARSFSGDGGPALAAKLDLPASVAFDDEQRLYVMDQANQLIRRIDPDGTIDTYAGVVETRDVTDTVTGAVTTLTKGWPGYAGDGGSVTEARFHASVGQAADPSSRITIVDGFLYLVDTDNHVVRRIDLSNDTIELFAGKVETRTGDFDANPTTPETTETRGFPGYADGERLEAAFNGPRDIEVDADGTVFVADTGNHCVRRISTDGTVDTVAGICGQPGFEGDDGPATEALLYKPYGIELTPDGGLLIGDSGNQVFRKLFP
jgi:hypothetical protein